MSAKLGSKMTKEVDLNPVTQCFNLQEIRPTKIVGQSVQTFKTIIEQHYNEYRRTNARIMGSRCERLV
jgi:hypothetical protein